MKNKKLLVFLLAAVSATAVGTAACKKDKGHEHSYTWHSSEEGHWQECVDGDDKKDIEVHVDVKNNETNADGKDGKCDVCDYALKQSVTYNMGGHGTAPDSQSVDFGAIISQPADPEEDAWDFLGWYKDAAFTTAFDFTAPINDDTVIYAKWEENTNPGESKKYAIKLEVDNDGYATDTAKFGKKGVIYFSYTAVVDGRYTVSLGLGVNSAKCYFTSDKDEDGAKYGYGQTADSHVYDIHEGEKVIISLKCDEELAADAQVGIAIQATYNEPLPADSWFSGIFADSTYTLTFDRENSSIEFLDTACSYNYLGGSFDTLYITHQSKVYKLQHKDGVAYKLVLPDNTSNTLIYFAELETPIADMSALEGTYKPAVADKDNKLTQVSIGENGECYYIFNGSKNDSNTPSFDGKYGIVYCGQYLFSVKLDSEGNVAGINVSGGNISSVVAYERTGDFVPGKLDIDSNSEFYGAEFTICDSGSAQYFGEKYGDPTVEITAYDKTTGIYTVDMVKDGEVLETYKLKIEGTGNDTVIKVYDKTGATLLDTLNKYFVNFVDLPTDGTTATPMPTADFKKNFYHFRANEAGWYTINCTDANLEVYTKLYADVPTNTEEAKKLDFKNGAVTVYLKEDAIIGVKSLYSVDNKPENALITIGLSATPPKGFVESDPDTMNGLGVKELDYLIGSYYLTLNPAEAGEYMIKVSFASPSGGASYAIHYSVDVGDGEGPVEVGYDYDSWSYIGITSANPDYSFTATANTPVSIVVVGESSYDWMAGGVVDRVYENVQITITKSYKIGAVDLDEFVIDGDPIDGFVPASVTVSAAGNYMVADTFGSPLVLTSSSEFTVIANGLPVEVTNANGTYTATVKAGTNLYVNVSAGVTFHASIKMGSEKIPFEISLTDGKYTELAAAEATTYFTFKQAGNFVASCGYNDVFVNGDLIQPGQSFTVAVGDVLYVQNYNDRATTLTVSIAAPSDIVGKYTVGDDETLVSIGATSVTVGDKAYSLTAISGNTYTYTAADNSTVTLTVGDTLTLGGQELAEFKVFTDEQAGIYNYSFYSIKLNADGTGVYNCGPMGQNNFEVSKNNDTYTFTYEDWWDSYTVTFTFNGDGTIVVTDTNSQLGLTNAVFTKGSENPVEGDTYVGLIGEQWTAYITLDSSFTTASITLVDEANDETDGPYEDLEVSFNEGTYSFTYGSGWNETTITFTENDDGTLAVSNNWSETGTLTKQS
ncbi:MAG: InlB B-repeat-containing protein [Clostridia bacterium]|nr:InlB B-repeat-containing protein [Clostridia bacterium]